MEITECLNEWNATIEALGQGKQTILIRRYKTNLKDFLLYPTINYLKNYDFLDSFDEVYHPFAHEFAVPKKVGKKIEVKYYAKVEKIINKPSSRISSFDNYHIWTNDHVKSYLDGKNANIWLLRVYKLDKPLILSRTKGIVYSNVEEPVSLNKIEPVLYDKEFNKIKNEILSK